MIAISVKAIIGAKHPKKPSTVPSESTIAIPIGGHKANTINNPKYSNIFIWFWSLFIRKNNTPIRYIK